MKVARIHIDRYVQKNRPNGIWKLSQRATVSTSILNRARLGQPPKLQTTRERIAEALGLPHDEIFQPESGEGQAS